MKKNLAAAIAVLLSVSVLQACVPTAVGAGATVGVAAAQEGGIKVAAADAAIRMQIFDAWFKHSTAMVAKLDMTVKEGRVLLTGSVPTPDMRVDAVRLVWQVNGVRQVINEIQVDSGKGITGYATDTWITGNLKAQLLMDKYIQSINYTVETVGGTVYLMGIAQDQKELDRVINYARNTRYVKNVVSYVRMRGEILQGMQTPTGAPQAPAPVTQVPYNAPADADAYPVYSAPAPVEASPL
jgi:osmotically-inducible protein OsmY